MNATSDARRDYLMHRNPHRKTKGKPFDADAPDACPSEVPADGPERVSYKLPDLRKGDPSADDPLKGIAWPERRELIYSDPNQP